MPISALPTPPSRSDAPQDFSDRADALLGALPGFVSEANALQSDVNAKESSASSHATIATDKAAEAQGHATTASTKASEAAASAIAAAAAASNAEIAFDSFDDKYLGSKASDPATDNDGNPLLTGALYWNTTVGAVRVWNGAAWLSMAADASIVDFQQSGAGAVVRTAQDKLREWVSIKDFGAVGDGVADDAPALRAAMAALVQRGGGHLYIPAGTYYLNSGDPRGLNLVPVTGKTDYYTVCEIGSGVTVYGDGDSTELLYESNRVGEYLTADPSDGIFRGDVGALFANFRVRANNNAPYAVSSFHVRDFKVRYTTLTNQAKDYIDGQVVRVYSNSGAVANGSFTVKNVNVTSNPGHQCFSYEKVDSFDASDNRIYSPGYSSNPSNSDHSVFFITGTRARYTGNQCFGAAPDKNSTFFESHCLYNDITGNLCFGMNVFANAVSQVVHPGTAYDFSQFRIAHNYARQCKTFVVDFCYTANRKSSLHIENNKIVLLATLATDTEAIVRYANDTGAAEADILPTILLVIRGNTVDVNDAFNGEIAYATSFDALINHSQATNIVIEDNEIRSARRAVVNIGGVKVRDVYIAENRLLNACSAGNSTNDTSARASRCAILCTLTPGSLLERLAVVDNTIGVGYGGAQSSYAIFVANFFGAASASKFLFKRNVIISGTSRNIFVDAQGSNAHVDDAFEVDHDHTSFDSTSTYAELVSLGAPVTAIKAGSVGTYGDVRVVMVGSAGSKTPRITAVGTAPPVARYWFQGSLVEHLAPAASGNIGWVCTAPGTPGTWKTYGAISA